MSACVLMLGQAEAFQNLHRSICDTGLMLTGEPDMYSQLTCTMLQLGNGQACSRLGQISLRTALPTDICIAVAQQDAQAGDHLQSTARAGG